MSGATAHGGAFLAQRLPHADGLPAPSYATAGAAGLDLRAACNGDIILAPGCRTLVPTGFCFAIPAGWEIQIRPRSGLAVKHGVTVLNTPGTIDSDYRGEVKICLINLGDAPFTITRGDRIAQAVVAQAPQWPLVEVDALEATLRGAGGFGSTGVG